MIARHLVKSVRSWSAVSISLHPYKQSVKKNGKHAQVTEQRSDRCAHSQIEKQKPRQEIRESGITKCKKKKKRRRKNRKMESSINQCFSVVWLSEGCVAE